MAIGASYENSEADLEARLQQCYEALRNARISLIAFGGDLSGLLTEAEAHECAVDMIQWALLRQIDECLAQS